MPTEPPRRRRCPDGGSCRSCMNLGEDFILDLRRPVVGGQRVTDGYVRLLGRRPRLMMAPAGKYGFGYRHIPPPQRPERLRSLDSGRLSILIAWPHAILNHRQRDSLGQSGRWRICRELSRQRQTTDTRMSAIRQMSPVHRSGSGWLASRVITHSRRSSMVPISLLSRPV